MHQKTKIAPKIAAKIACKQALTIIRIIGSIYIITILHSMIDSSVFPFTDR
jgi:hypothetical protein